MTRRWRSEGKGKSAIEDRQLDTVRIYLQSKMGVSSEADLFLSLSHQSRFASRARPVWREVEAGHIPWVEEAELNRTM